MNINKFDSFDRFNLELRRVLSSPTLKDANVSEPDIQAFINNNLNLIIRQRNNRSLQIELVRLANRIKREFQTPSGQQLSHKIRTVASVVFTTTIADCPRELINRFIDEALPKIDGCIPLYKKQEANKVLNGVKQASNQFRRIGKESYDKWISENSKGISSKIAECKTAEEAVNYAIQNKLTSVDLKKFEDLDDTQFQRLVENCSNIKHLSIGKCHLTQTSADLIGSLLTLTTFHYTNCFESIDFTNNHNLREVIVSGGPMQITFAKEANELQILKIEGEGMTLNLPEIANFLEILELTNWSFAISQITLPRQANSLKRLKIEALFETDSATSLIFPEKIDALETLNLHISDLSKLILPRVANALRSVKLKGLGKIILPLEAKALQEVMCRDKYATDIIMPKKTGTLESFTVIPPDNEEKETITILTFAKDVPHNLKRSSDRDLPNPKREKKA